MSQINPEILDQALLYSQEWGWRVLPLYSIENGKCTCGKACSSPGKHPATRNGLKDATRDETQIRAWFENHNYNIGIATGPESNLVVVDVDVDKGADIIDLTMPEGVIAPLDGVLNTVSARTGGGWHYYYLYPDGEDLKNTASRLGKFIDTRGSGGYVVAPPSIHISGKIYEFDLSFENLRELPKEWIEILKTPTQTAPPAQNGNGLHIPPPGVNDNPDVVPSGQRNNVFASLAGKMRHYGFGQKAIEDALLAENERICQPPMEEREVRDIARKIAQKYAPAVDLTDPNIAAAVGEDLPPDGDEDFENTLQAYRLGDFLDMEFQDLEILAFDISATEIGIIQAPTNAGKTTILRNAALAMTCGRPFEPFFDGHRPIKVAYFDFESSAQKAQPDLRTMIDALTDDEKQLARENLILIPKGLMNGELFQFNRAENWVNSLLKSEEVEFVFVDNISAAYDLNDENSNAEINKKVIKPLLKMAYKGNAAFLFAHHYGKGKNELETAGVHAGRGASNLQGLSQTVINMFGNVSKGEPITIECAKRKTNGGQNYREVFELRDDRWFHHTTIAPPPKQRSCSETINEFISDNVIYPSTITPADLADVFEGVFGIDMINKTLKQLADSGFISKLARGEYCARRKKKFSKNAVENDEEESEL